MPLDWTLDVAPDEKIGIWLLSESVSQLLERLPELSDSPDFVRHHTQKRKTEWLAVRVLFAEMGHDPGQITYNSSGKPVLVDNAGFLSISHSDGRVAVMYSKHSGCGIDIQRIKGNAILKGIHFFMSDAEQELVWNTPDPVLSAFACWGAKEACFKMAGGSSDTLQSFVVNKLNWVSPGKAAVSLSFGKGGGSVVRCMTHGGDAMLAFCSETQGRIF